MNWKRFFSIVFCSIALLVNTASADFVSTFTTTSGDIVVTGFAAAGVPTGGPLVLTTTSPTGSYVLDIPPIGTLSTVFVSGSTSLDLDANGSLETVIPIPLTNAGMFVSPGVGSLPSWSGSVLLPDFDYDPILPGPIVTISGVTLDFVLDVDNTAYPSGSYGPSASTVFTLSGGNLLAINTDLTFVDSISPSPNNGQLTIASASSLTVTAVPEPSAFLFGGIFLIGSLLSLAAKKRSLLLTDEKLAK